MINMIKKKKGFTLIELIIVIAVIGILVLLAAPKFLGYTKDAKETQMKSDINAVSKIVSSEMLEAEAAGIDYLSQLDKVSLDNIEEYASSGQLFDKNGEANVITETPFYKVKDESVRAAGGKLNGDFIIDSEGETYYVNEAHSNNENNTDEDIYLATDEDFEWERGFDGYYVDGEYGQGYYKYIGSEEEVEIPHEIKGHKVTSYYGMFSDIDFNENIKRVVSTNKNVTDMTKTFDTFLSTSLDLSNFDTSGVKTMDEMFFFSRITELDLSNFVTDNVESMDFMFQWSHATSLNLSNWNTENVVNMEGLFDNSSATSLNLSSFDTSNVENMKEMFHNSQASSLILGENFDTGNVTDMRDMFRRSAVLSLDLNDWNTGSVTDMRRMFNRSKVKTLDLSNWDTSNVTDMEEMFSESEITSLDVSGFDTEQVTTMRWMFKESKMLKLDLSSFDTSEVTVSGMFRDSEAKKGYARTEDDIETFNQSGGKPDSLIFEVKKQE